MASIDTWNANLRKIAKKKGDFPKPRPASSYSIYPYAVLTSGQDNSQRWTDEANKKVVPKAVWDEFHSFDWSESPCYFMTDVRSMTEYIRTELERGTVPAEYIGNHGVGGLLFPPLDFFDDHHDWVCDTDAMRDKVQRWKELTLREAPGEEPECNDVMEASLLPPETNGGLFGPRGRNPSDDDEDEAASESPADDSDREGSEQDDDEADSHNDATIAEEDGVAKVPSPLPASQVEPLDSPVVDLESEEAMAEERRKNLARTSERQANIVAIKEALSQTPVSARPECLHDHPEQDEWFHELSQQSVSVRFGDLLIDDVFGECRYSHWDTRTKQAFVVFGDGEDKLRTVGHLNLKSQSATTAAAMEVEAEVIAGKQNAGTQNAETMDDAEDDVNAPAVKSMAAEKSVRKTVLIGQVSDFVKALHAGEGQVHLARITMKTEVSLEAVFIFNGESEEFLNQEVIPVDGPPLADNVLLRSLDFNEVLMANSAPCDLSSTLMDCAASKPFAAMMTAALPAAVQSFWGSGYVSLGMLSTRPTAVIDPLSIVMLTKKGTQTIISAAVLIQDCCPLRLSESDSTILYAQRSYQIVKFKRFGRRHQSGWIEWMRPSFTVSSSNQSKQVLNKGDFPFFNFNPESDPYDIHRVLFPGQQSCLTPIEVLIEVLGMQPVLALNTLLTSMDMYKEFREVNAMRVGPELTTLKLFSYGYAPADGTVGTSSSARSVNELPVDIEDRLQLAAAKMAAQSAHESVKKAFSQFTTDAAVNRAEELKMFQEYQATLKNCLVRLKIVKSPSVAQIAFEECVPKAPIPELPKEGARVADSRLPEDARTRKKGSNMSVDRSPQKPKQEPKGKKAKTGCEPTITELDDDDDDMAPRARPRRPSTKASFTELFGESDDDDFFECNDDGDDDDEDDDEYEEPDDESNKSNHKSGRRPARRSARVPKATKEPTEKPKEKPEKPKAKPSKDKEKPEKPKTKPKDNDLPPPPPPPPPPPENIDAATVMTPVVQTKPTAFHSAAKEGTQLKAKELEAFAKLGLSPTPSSCGVSVVDLNSMFERESTRTKSECLSEANTLINAEMFKEKDRAIAALEKQLTELQVKYDHMTTTLMAKTAEAAEQRALAAARSQQIDEAKATATTWHELADTLRKDQKELLQMWK